MCLDRGIRKLSQCYSLNLMLLEPFYGSFVYSETCLEQPLKKRQNRGLKDRRMLSAGPKYCRMLRAFCNTFDLHLVIIVLEKHILGSPFEGPLKAGFTVYYLHASFLQEFKLKAHLARHLATAHGLAIRAGSPRPVMKTRAAFCLVTTSLTRISRRLCSDILRPHHAARSPFVPINTAAIKQECKYSKTCVKQPL